MVADQAGMPRSEKPLLMLATSSSVDAPWASAPPISGVPGGAPSMRSPWQTAQCSL